MSVSGKSLKIFNPPPQKDKKRFPKFLAIILIILLITGALIYWLFFSSFFQIKNITFEDMNLENVDLNSIKGRNILLINTSKIKSKIFVANSNISDVKITRGIPDTLKIKIEFHQAILIWRTTDRQYLTNKEGNIMGEVQGETALPIVQDNKNLAVSLGQQVVSSNFIEFIQELYSKFTNSFGFRIVYFEVNETIFQVDAMTDQGWFIKLDTTRSADNQLDALKQLLSAHKDEIHEYADVRVEGKVFFK